MQCVFVSPRSTFEWLNPYKIKLGMNIMTPEPSNGVLKKPSHQPVPIYSMYSTIVARQRLGKIFTAATNTHATKEDLLTLVPRSWIFLP
jgi:hypothetical protein